VQTAEYAKSSPSSVCTRTASSPVSAWVKGKAEPLASSDSATMASPSSTSGPPATLPAVAPVSRLWELPPAPQAAAMEALADPRPRMVPRRMNRFLEMCLSPGTVGPFSIRYTLTMRAVAYMTTMPVVSPPRFEPERTGVLDRSESFRRRRVTSYITWRMAPAPTAKKIAESRGE
jgi:hypothetical protein